MNARHIDTVEVAKLVRRELKSKWPKQKFSVTSSRYSGGSSIDVSWFDGPTRDAVEKVVGKYHGADFDGMIDLKSYHDSVLGDEIVSFGNDYIFCHRRVTNEDELRILAETVIRERCKTEGTPPHDLFGNQWVTDLARAMVYSLEFPTPSFPVTAGEWDRAFKVAVLREAA